MLQGLIHGKGRKGNACDTEQTAVFVADIEIKPAHLLRGNRKSAAIYEAHGVGPGQSQNDLELLRKAGALNDLEA